MALSKRRKTPIIKIGSLSIGGDFPVAIQSMTDTPTSDIVKTVQQIVELIKAGSQLVRLTINDDQAAEAVPEIVNMIRGQGIQTPLIGDFHFNGHILLNKYPRTAKALDKYRINPGNLGKGKRHDENFASFIRIAVEYAKPVRIGVNWGSLNQELLTELMDKNSRKKKPKDFKKIANEAMLESALRSAQTAQRIGLKENQIVLSVKISDLQDLIEVNSRLAEQCEYCLHLGLTEAGSDLQGSVSSAAALAILLQQGIGDTIRVSLTPQPGMKRSREVEVGKALLQSMGLGFFQPKVISCPGCGRTSSDFFQVLAQGIHQYIVGKMPIWKVHYPGVEKITIAVMGCVVNGPGESRHANIGISLPGSSEKPLAPVFVDGKQTIILKGERIQEEFIGILEDYIRNKFSKE